MVSLVPNIFTWPVIFSSRLSFPPSLSMSSPMAPAWVPSHVMPSGGVVPHAVPPLPLPDMCPKHPHLPSKAQDCIAPSPLRPHVTATDHFTFWLSPYGLAQMNAQASLFPPEIIIRRHLVMAQCVMPTTLKNYAAGLSRFTKFCDDFKIPKVK